MNKLYLKAFITFICIAFSTISSGAEGWACSASVGCNIASAPSLMVNKGAGVVMLKVDNANYTDIVGCNSNHVIDISDEIGKAMLSIVLMAKATQKKVGIYLDSNYQVSGNCIIRDLRLID